jgi:hypothetical protein
VKHQDTIDGANQTLENSCVHMVAKTPTPHLHFGGIYIVTLLAPNPIAINCDFGCSNPH